jgi:hypothetical protein
MLISRRSPKARRLGRQAKRLLHRGLRKAKQIYKSPQIQAAKQHVLDYVKRELVPYGKAAMQCAVREGVKKLVAGGTLQDALDAAKVCAIRYKNKAVGKVKGDAVAAFDKHSPVPWQTIAKHRSPRDSGARRVPPKGLGPYAR